MTEEVQPVLEIIPLQLLAYEVTIARGQDPDAPRALAKVTETHCAGVGRPLCLGVRAAASSATTQGACVCSRVMTSTHWRRARVPVSWLRPAGLHRKARHKAGAGAEGLARAAAGHP